MGKKSYADKWFAFLNKLNKMQNQNIEIEQLKKFSGHFQDLVNEIENLITTEKVNSSKTDELVHLTNNLQKFFRESFQEIQKAKIQELIKKLKNNLNKDQGINTEELTLLREVMIGEADNYITNENGKQAWIQKLKEYSSLIGELSQEALSGNYLFKMTGKSVTACRLAQDLNFYFQQAERVQNFNQSVNNGIDNLETKFLIDSLQYKLTSKE